MEGWGEGGGRGGVVRRTQKRGRGYVVMGKHHYGDVSVLKRRDDVIGRQPDRRRERLNKNPEVATGGLD